MTEMELMKAVGERIKNSQEFSDEIQKVMVKYIPKCPPGKPTQDEQDNPHIQSAAVSAVMLHLASYNLSMAVASGLPAPIATALIRASPESGMVKGAHEALDMIAQGRSRRSADA